jgi:hypothetical protein
LLHKVAQTPGAQKLGLARQSRPHCAFDEDQRSAASTLHLFKIALQLDDWTRGSGAGPSGGCKNKGILLRFDAKQPHLRRVRGRRRIQLKAIR